jgi:glucose/arabinose dehydrogenase
MQPHQLRGNSSLRRTWRWLALLALLALAPISTGRADGPTLPANFVDTPVISGLSGPTEFQFADDGRVFIAEKSGVIKVFDSLSDTTPTIFADLSRQVYNYWDRGLLGLALDPKFTDPDPQKRRPYVYVLYTYNAPPGQVEPYWPGSGGSDRCPDPPGATKDGCVVTGRLSRLTANGNQMAGAEQVLITDWCQQFPSHSIGTLAFDRSGALLVSAGDGANFNVPDYGQLGGSSTPLNPCSDPPNEGGALRAQDALTTGANDPTSLDGTILRLDPETGQAKSDNPSAGSTDPNIARMLAQGLRNPFRFTINPSNGDIYIGDVGWKTWEEINYLPVGATSRANFGWPCYEGIPKQDGYKNLALCQTLYNQSGAVSQPLLVYKHSDTLGVNDSQPYCQSGGSAVSGVAFYTDGNYPDVYHGALFFADYSRNCIYVKTPGAASPVVFARGAPSPISLKTGPDGDLFYLDINGGTLHRIRYISPNSPPIAVARATPTNGIRPLRVTFDGSDSRDGNGDPLTYEWDFDGDGQYDASGVTVVHTYDTPGRYTARLRVTDTSQASASASIDITVGPTAPNPPVINLLEPATPLYQVGTAIRFSGSATDSDNTPIPAENFSWSLRLHHCYTLTNCHVHDLFSLDGTDSGSYVAPEHEYPNYIEIVLTVTNRYGLSATTVKRLDALTSDLTFTSQPVGLNMVINGTGVTTPYTTRVMRGGAVVVSGPQMQMLDGTPFIFAGWADLPPQNAPSTVGWTRDITANAPTATYTATYQIRIFVPVVRR